MGMGDKDEIDGVGSKGEFAVGNFVAALLETTVNQDAFAVDFQAVAASGDALVRAVKAELHK